MRRVSTLFVTFLLCLIVIGAAGVSYAAHGLVPVHYELDIVPDYDAATLRASAEIEVVNRSTAPAGSMSCLLHRLMPVERVTGVDDHCADFIQNIVSMDDFPLLQVNHLVITFDEPVPAGESAVVRIEYGGHLVGYTEAGMLYVQDCIDRDFTMIRNDAFAFPLVCAPSIAAMRASVENTFTYQARITVPDDLVVANGGRLLSREAGPNGSVTFTYASIEPSWRMDFAIADYAFLDRGPVRVCFLPGDDAGAGRVADAAAATLAHYEEWFGPLNAEAGLTFIEIPDGMGSQADVTTVIQTSAAFSDPERVHEVYHEVSHLWNAPAIDHPSPRWEEGLAMFLEYLVLEVESGEPATDARANELVERLSERLVDGPAWASVPFAEYGDAGLTDLSYTVGGLFFDLMYRVAGPEAFNSAIRDYLEEYGSDGGTTDDFGRVARERCPDGVGTLLEEWVYTTRWTERVSEVGGVEELASFYR